MLLLLLFSLNASAAVKHSSADQLLQYAKIADTALRDNDKCSFKVDEKVNSITLSIKDEKNNAFSYSITRKVEISLYSEKRIPEDSYNETFFIKGGFSIQFVNGGNEFLSVEMVKSKEQIYSCELTI